MSAGDELEALLNGHKGRAPSGAVQLHVGSEIDWDSSAYMSKLVFDSVPDAVALEIFRGGQYCGFAPREEFEQRVVSAFRVDAGTMGLSWSHPALGELRLEYLACPEPGHPRGYVYVEEGGAVPDVPCSIRRCRKPMKVSEP